MYKELIRSIENAVAFNLDNADKADVQRSSFTAGMVKAYTDVLRDMGHKVETGNWEDNGCDRVGFIKINGVFLVMNSKINFDSFGLSRRHLPSGAVCLLFRRFQLPLIGLPHKLVQIFHAALDLLRHLLQDFVPLICNGVLAVQRLIDTAVNLGELLVRELAVLIHQPRPAGEVQLGSVVVAVIMALGHAGAVCGTLLSGEFVPKAALHLPSGQHDAVKAGQKSENFAEAVRLHPGRGGHGLGVLVDLGADPSHGVVDTVCRWVIHSLGVENHPAPGLDPHGFLSPSQHGEAVFFHRQGGDAFSFQAAG